MTIVNGHQVIWLPAVLGGAFPLLVKLHHWLFGQSLISVRYAIGAEAIYLLLCFFAIIMAAVLAVRMIRKKELACVLWIAISVFAGLYLLGVGIESGAAVVYAT